VTKNSKSGNPNPWFLEFEVFLNFTCPLRLYKIENEHVVGRCLGRAEELLNFAIVLRSIPSGDQDGLVREAILRLQAVDPTSNLFVDIQSAIFQLGVVEDDDSEYSCLFLCGRKKREL